MELSKRQQKAALDAAGRHLDALAVVYRNTGPTTTATGRQKGLTVVYDQIPSHLAPGTSSNPTAFQELKGTTSEMDARAYAWFPVKWPEGPQSGWADPPVQTDVHLKLGDIIEIGGHRWTCTTDEDPGTGFQARRRVRVSRTHEGVTP